LGRSEDALADFDGVLVLAPDNAWTFGSRGETLRRLGQYEEALADFNRALDQEPYNDWRLYNQALTYHFLERAAEGKIDLTTAIQHARQVYQEDQQNWINAFNLALYLLAAGESEEAERLNRKILSLGVPRYNILEAIHDLDDFLALFP